MPAVAVPPALNQAADRSRSAPNLRRANPNSLPRSRVHDASARPRAVRFEGPQNRKPMTHP